jgi:competence protein ComEC
MDYFFIFIVGFSSGVLARSLFVFGWGALAFVLLLALVFAVMWMKDRAKQYAVVVVFLLAAALGVGRTVLVPQALPLSLESLVGTTVSLDGVVSADPDIRDVTQRVTVSVKKDGVQTRILAVASLYPELSYGEHVTISGKLEKPKPFDSEGGRVFRYDQYLAKDGIFGIIQQAYIKSTAPPSGFFTHALDLLYGAKHVFVNGLEEALPEPASALAEGLLVGGKQGLGKTLTDDFTAAGLIAIVVLSGYNVMIVAEAVMRGFSFLPKRFAISAAGLAIIGFVIAAGSGSSALRAGLMACLALYARSTGRSYNALRALFFVLLVLLLWNPLSLAFDPGFELSFIATFGLIIGTPLIEARILFIKNAFLREIAATTTAAQIAVVPLLIYITGNLSFVSLPANLLVLPVVPLTMLLSFIAGLIGIVFPAIAPVLGLPAYIFLSYIIWMGKFAAGLPLAHMIVPAFSIVFVVIAYVLLWRLVLYLRRSSTSKPSLKIGLHTPSN